MPSFQVVVSGRVSFCYDLSCEVNLNRSDEVGSGVLSSIGHVTPRFALPEILGIWTFDYCALQILIGVCMDMYTHIITWNT